MTWLTSRVKKTTGMNTSILMQKQMTRFLDQVTRGAFSKAFLIALGPLMEQCPGMFLADGRVEGLEYLLEVHTLHIVQGAITASGRRPQLLSSHHHGTTSIIKCSQTSPKSITFVHINNKDPLSLNKNLHLNFSTLMSVIGSNGNLIHNFGGKMKIQ